MAFNVNRYLIRVRGGQQYLPVSARLVWFREERPDWSIETHPLHLDFNEGVAVFQAVVKDTSGRIVASATKMETRSDFVDFVEKAETGAVGRVLAMCGFGTQFALELSEGDVVSGEVAFADSPLPLHAEGPDAEVSETPPPAMVCAECERTLRKPQFDLSLRKYGRPLCPDCQKHASASVS